jgi:hypothetical protein
MADVQTCEIRNKDYRLCWGETQTSIFVGVLRNSTQILLTPLGENLTLDCSTVSKTLDKKQL